MITLLALAAADGGEGVRLTVETDGETERLTVSVEDHFALALQKGTLAEEQYAEIVAAAEKYAARRAALRMLSAGQCSCARLYQKLRARGIPGAAARDAAEFASAHGYIDERAQIESYVKQMVERKYMGRRKILPMLLAKGYKADEICAVLDAEYTDRDFARAKQEFLQKKFGKTVPATLEEAQEMKKALYKQGY